MFLPDLNRKKSRLRQFLTWTFVVLLIALAFSAKPIYHIFKKRRSESLAQEGQSLLTEKKGDAALAKLQAALEMNPNNFHANYGMAQLLTAARRNEAFSYWNAVFRDGGNSNDRIEAAKLAIFLNRQELVGKYLDPVLQQAPVPPEAFRVAAIFCDQRNLSDTMRFARLYLQSNPDDPQMNLLLARRLLSSNKPDDTRQAKPLLWKSLRAGGATASQALQLLAVSRDLTTNEVQELLATLDKQPASESTRLLKMDLQERLTPGSKDDVIAKAIADAKDSPEKFVALGRWLNQRGEYETVKKILPLEAALKSRDLFQIYADALAGTGKWGDLQTVFMRDQLPIEPVQAEVFRARIAMELKSDPERAQLHWQTALSLAGENAAALKYVGGYAERIGVLDRAADAYHELAKIPANTREAYGGLIRIAERKGDTAGLRDLMQTLVETSPNDPAPQNDLAYLDLLLNKDVSNARQVAEKLVQQDPKLLAYHTTLALACLRAGDAAAAMQAYKSIATFTWADVLPGWQAVYVATMGANGSNTVARQLAPTIPVNRLKPEEKQLIQPWLN